MLDLSTAYNARDFTSSTLEIGQIKRKYPSYNLSSTQAAYHLGNDTLALYLYQRDLGHPKGYNLTWRLLNQDSLF